jgi:hypothetical protein
MKMIMRVFVKNFAHILTIVSIVIFMELLFSSCKKNDSSNNNIPVDSTKVDLQLAADGFVSPIGVIASPDNTGRLFVVDQVRKIWIIDQAGNNMGPSGTTGKVFKLTKS